jgi:hypothetical protein
MADLVHDVVIAIAAFLGNPRDVLKMALLCPSWYGLLEQYRTSVLAETFGVPAARCSGSTSLADALGLWAMYLHAKWEYLMERDIEPGTTIPLRTQLALMEPPTSGASNVNGFTVSVRLSPGERRYVLADGLMTHATLFGNALQPGLRCMWGYDRDARERGRCLYLLLASPMESIPMEDLVQVYVDAYSFSGVALMLYHTFKPLLEEWTDDQINTRAVTFVTRFTQFVGHSAMRSRFVSTYYREQEQLDLIGTILGKLVFKCTVNRDALSKACTTCLDVFQRAVIGEEIGDIEIDDNEIPGH